MSILKTLKSAVASSYPDSLKVSFTEDKGKKLMIFLDDKQALSLNNYYSWFNPDIWKELIVDGKPRKCLVIDYKAGVCHRIEEMPKPKDDEEDHSKIDEEMDEELTEEEIEEAKKDIEKEEGEEEAIKKMPLKLPPSISKPQPAQEKKIEEIKREKVSPIYGNFRTLCRCRTCLKYS